MDGGLPQMVLFYFFESFHVLQSFIEQTFLFVCEVLHESIIGLCLNFSAQSTLRLKDIECLKVQLDFFLF